MYIPSQSDGRFNIAYVQWSSDKVENGQITITIGKPSKYPTNDGQVGEWFDSSGNAQLATILKLKTEGKMQLKQFQIELKALLDKYPNINKIDISEVYILKSSQEDIINAIISVWNNKYAGWDIIPQLTIHISVNNDVIVENGSIKSNNDSDNSVSNGTESDDTLANGSNSGDNTK